LAGFAGDAPFPYFEGTLAEAQAQAKQNGQPLLVYVATESLPVVQQLQRQTLSDPMLQPWLESHYVTYLHPVSLDTMEACRLPYYTVEAAPTLLIYHPDGRLMGTIGGYVTPSTLKEILTRHYERIYPDPQPEVLPFRRVTPQVIAVQVALTQSIDLQVNGLEAYSLQQLKDQVQTDLQLTLGLRVGDYHSYRKVRRQIRRMEKIWPGELWVYSQSEQAQAPVYTLVLGTFEDLITANRYAHAMDSYAMCEGSILDLSYLVRQP
jgi:hypothetical protein